MSNPPEKPIRHVHADAQPPVDDRGVHVQAYHGAAAGMGAVKSIAVQGIKEVGPIRAMRLLGNINQRKGFDCPGCAWPDPMKRTPFEFCENGAKAVYEEATPLTVGARFFAQHSIDELCTLSDFELGKSGRLTEPMFRAQGASHYTPITWDDAFTKIAETLHALPSPDDAIFYTSGRCSNEAAFLYQLFVRKLGTNNLPDCSNLCHESSGKGLGSTVGSGKGSVTLEDFPRSDAVFVFGQNPGTNHPRMLTALQEAKRAGAKIVSINPLVERGLERFAHPQEPTALLGNATELTDLYLQVRVNGDIALIKGMCKAILERETTVGGILDHSFIETYTSGFDAFIANVETESWETICTSSGIAKEDIEAAAKIYWESNATITCWAMGLTQHENSVETIQYVVNLLLLRGNIGKPGAGPCPVRGHSNVQGDRTMGIWEAPPEAFLQRLGQRFEFTPPRKHGYAAVEAIQAMHNEPGKVFFALGGNFISANPDTDYTASALQRCRLTVQVSTKLNRSHLITGQEALILPCLGRTDIDHQAAGEQFITTENSQGYVGKSQGFLKPPSRECRSEPDIIAQLAHHVFGPNDPIPWTVLAGDYREIRAHIAEVIPGHEAYEERILNEGGFFLPHPNRERKFPTSNGKAQFTCASIPPERLQPGQLMLMTMRSHDQYNTTIYGLDDRYRGIYGGRRVLLMNPEDMAERNLTDQDRVDIISHFNGVQRIAYRFKVIGYALPRRSCGAYFPEANVLVPIDSYARKSKTPTSKSIVITVKASE